MGGIKRVPHILKKLMFDKDYRFHFLADRGFYDKLSDEEYLKRAFKARLGQNLNLDNPCTFNEKLQWLKINDRKPIYTKMVDKYEAKQFVADKIGKKYIIPTLGVWTNFDNIDFDKLPNEFVLKCTHDSGGVVFCRNKSVFDLSEAKRKINSAISQNFYFKCREWPYKNIIPRIIAERYLGTTELNDYKLQCFNGKFDNIFVAEGRYSKRGVRYHYFDKDWNYLPYCPYDDIDVNVLKKLKPGCYEEMIDIAEKLSENLPELRVDLYEVDGKIYFGEMTFYSQSGFDTDITKEADKILGNKLDIQRMKNEGI